MGRFRTGVCYYPEHWPEDIWHDDAARMVDAGLSIVRIGEFAWSRLEPTPGRYDFGWLDRALDTLSGAGLSVMLGTPTATPPKWLVDAHPSILAYDRQGRTRRFGSRRHYCFSSPRYRAETARIVELLAKRYGTHPAITSWQTDNEFGCHDTVRSYSPAAAVAFRDWLRLRYPSVEAMNEAWGTVFWSQEYTNFSQVDLPNLTVTEPHPAHVLDFYRFSSDQVISYHRLQADIIRAHAPGKDIVHNVMGFFFDFDHFALGKACDSLGWDSYPLGFLDVGPFPPHLKDAYRRQGHPDLAAFHHDLYRACGRGRWSVIEQQPGPVNWAHHNPAPLDGMVHLWTVEAFAHGAEAVQYFRWRQAPFAQEQMHAGLLRPDHQPAPGLAEAKRAAATTADIGDNSSVQGDIAILFDYEAFWVYEAQPQGRDWFYPRVIYDWYSACRQQGANIDFVAPGQPLNGYKVVIVPSVPIISDATVSALAASGAHIILGARSGSKSISLTVPDGLAPGPLRGLSPLTVEYSESLPETAPLCGHWGDVPVEGILWRDHVSTTMTTLAADVSGHPLILREGAVWWLTTHPAAGMFARLLGEVGRAAGLHLAPLPEGVRRRDIPGGTVWLNYAATAERIPSTDDFILGGADVPPAGVAVSRAPAGTRAGT